MRARAAVCCQPLCLQRMYSSHVHTPATPVGSLRLSMGRVHGLKSGRMLKEFRGHTSYVNDAIFSADGSQVGPRRLMTSTGRVLNHGNVIVVRWWDRVAVAGHPVPAQVISASSDATVRVWDAKSCDCITIFKCVPSPSSVMRLQAIAKPLPALEQAVLFAFCRPPQAASGAEQSVNSVHLNPQNAEQVVVCSRAPTAHVMTLQGQVVKTFQSGGSGQRCVQVDTLSCPHRMVL